MRSRARCSECSPSASAFCRVTASPRRKNFRLPLKSPQAFFVLGELFRQDLDRHIPSELPIPGPIHLSLYAFPNGLENLVVGEFVAGYE